MNKNITLFFLLSLLFCLPLYAQTVEEMQVQKAQKEQELSTLEPQLKDLSGQVEALKADIAGLTDKLTPYPRWDVGALGNVGLNFAQFNDWFSKSSANTTAFTIGLTSNAFANLQQKKYFWRNGANLTLGWLRFDNKDDDVKSDTFSVTADAFNVVSLFGYKLNEKLALSTLGEYRTSILDSKFNNPGYLDIGVGATWTPITDLVVVFHPLNYNFVFADSEFDYESSLGCKVVADYTRAIAKGISWKSNLSAFLSYKNIDFSNWTWVNSFSTAVKGIGIGVDIGLRGNKQEAFNFAASAADPYTGNLEDFDDNKIQTYFLIGLSYAFATKK